MVTNRDTHTNFFGFPGLRYLKYCTRNSVIFAETAKRPIPSHLRSLIPQHITEPAVNENQRRRLDQASPPFLKQSANLLLVILRTAPSMMVEQKDTMDESLPSNGGEAGYVSEQKESADVLASNAHRIALASGVCGILILAAVAAVVVGLIGSSFSGSSPDSAEAVEFDFENLGQRPDFTGVRTPAPRTPSPSVQSSTPSIKPSAKPSSKPSPTPSQHPSSGPTDIPSTLPSKQPTNVPSVYPTIGPTGIPSVNPTFNPTREAVPSPDPTRMPNTDAPITPVNITSETLLTFCVIADVPYFDIEREKLPGQVENQIEGCEFLVHLGDIMQGDITCDVEHYEFIRSALLRSTIPTFIIPGDNEWNDCGDSRAIIDAWSNWENYLMHLDQNWNHSFGVVRQPNYPENFYFIRKRTLIFGLNIVGGRVHDRSEWYRRLSAEIQWVKQITEMNIPMEASGIIILGHARPTANHNPFFEPLRDFVRDELENRVPVLYLHGDGHSYYYTRYFMDESNILEIQHEGGVRDPVLKILSDPAHLGPEVYDSFQVDRQLDLER